MIPFCLSMPQQIDSGQSVPSHRNILLIDKSMVSNVFEATWLAPRQYKLQQPLPPINSRYPAGITFNKRDSFQLSSKRHGSRKGVNPKRKHIRCLPCPRHPTASRMPMIIKVTVPNVNLLAGHPFYDQGCDSHRISFSGMDRTTRYSGGLGDTAPIRDMTHYRLDLCLYLTTGHFSFRSAFINSGPACKLSSTRSHGVSAIHWFSDTSAKRSLLNISKNHRL